MEYFVFTEQDARKASDLPTYDTTDYGVRNTPVISAVQATASATMPRRKTESDASSTGYMPGMEKKKKRGFFGLFHKRKGGDFQVVSGLVIYL